MPNKFFIQKHYDYTPEVLKKSDDVTREVAESSSDKKMETTDESSTDTYTTTTPNDEYATAPSEVSVDKEMISAPVVTLPMDSYVLPTTTMASTTVPYDSETPPKVIDRYNPPLRSINSVEKSDPIHTAINKINKDAYASNTSENGGSRKENSNFDQLPVAKNGNREDGQGQSSYEERQKPLPLQKPSYSQPIRPQTHQQRMLPIPSTSEVPQRRYPQAVPYPREAQHNYQRPSQKDYLPNKPMRDDPRQMTGDSELVPLPAARPKYPNQPVQGVVLPNEPVLHQPVSLIQRPWSARVKIR